MSWVSESARLPYSGQGNWKRCTSIRYIQAGSGSEFAGSSETNLEIVWSFYRRQQGNGGTPLAWVLGFDDSNNSGNQSGNVIDD